MTTYLGYVQTVANQLPVESLANTTLHWMHRKKLLENPSTIVFSGFNALSINSVVQIVSRAVGAYFVYPRISPIISLVNASIGIVHLGIGFTHRFRTLEAPKDAPEKWNSIALNLHKGFVHLLVAGYDFGIGFLLKQKYFDIAGIVAFSTLPVIALIYHQKVFKKPDVASILTSSEKEANVKSLLDEVKKRLDPTEILKSKISPSSMTSSMTPPTTPEKVVPTYLESTCLIYIIAKKITLELMPAIEPKESKNILEFLPNYGL